VVSCHVPETENTRAVTVFRDSFTEGFNYFVTTMVAPVVSGWSTCRMGCSPAGKAPTFGPDRFWSPAARRFDAPHGHW
jgi:hypothetical protein